MSFFKKMHYFFVLLFFSHVPFIYADSLDWIQYVESGQKFQVVFDQTQNKFDDAVYVGSTSTDPMGTLKGGEIYSVFYKNGSFSCEGYNQGANKHGTWSYSNANPRNNRISLWGRPFVFDGNGLIYDCQWGLVGHMRKWANRIGKEQTKTVTVSATYSTGRNKWMDSGVDVTAGDTLSILGEGTWRLGEGARECDADGLSNFPPYMGHLYGTLMGKIGPNGTIFPIGRNYNGNALANGRLFLGNNDSNDEDNSGALTVTVTTR